MSDAMQYGFHVGQRLASHNVKTAVNLNGIVKAFTGAANAASATKPVVAATAAPTGAAGAVSKMTTVGPGSFAAPAVNQARAAAAANPHAHQFGQPLKMAPPAGSAPVTRPAAPPPPPAAPPHAHQFGQPLKMAPPAGSAPVTRPAAPPPPPAAPFRAPEAVGTPTQGAQMFFDNAQSGGRQQMLGYGQRGAPSNLPQKWEQLSPEQQATVMKTLGY